MTSSELPRRDWIKKLALSIGAVAVAPTALWADTVEKARRNQVTLQTSLAARQGIKNLG